MIVANTVSFGLAATILGPQAALRLDGAWRDYSVISGPPMRPTRKKLERHRRFNHRTRLLQTLQDPCARATW